jgi:hypothetical protein
MGYTIWPDEYGNSLRDVYQECLRQEDLKREGKFHWTCADTKQDPNQKAILPSEKFAVLSEEVGEVAKHIVESIIDPTRYNPKELRKELIQIAAVCVAWCEAIDKEQ